MSTSHTIRRSLLALCLTLFAASAFAQVQTQKEFQPQVGQDGKDVVWVPTPEATVEAMLNMAKVTSTDYVIDLGSGDGRTVIAAAKRGARALGVEYNANMVELSRRNATSEGVGNRVTFVEADLFDTDLSKATVITMFLLPEINLRLRPRILQLKPGTRIVSNTFTMEPWRSDETISVDNGCTRWCTALLWIVPARVEGTWRLPQGELTLKQEFQMITGTLKSGSDTIPIAEGRLRGDQISFNAGGARYTGRVNGKAMEGTVTSGGGSSKWSATNAGG